MNYDEIDQYVDKLFDRQVLNGEVITDSGVDRVIEDAYRDVMDWHNANVRADAGRNGLTGSLARDTPPTITGGDISYIGASGSNERDVYRHIEQRVNQKAGRGGYTCGGFLAAAVMLVMLCAIGSGVILWLEEIAP